MSTSSAHPLASDLALRVIRSIDRLAFPGASRSVHCQDAGDRIVLEGRVDSYYLKQVCQTIAAKVPGVRRVDNRLNVGAP
jgi:hypothetical protein